MISPGQGLIEGMDQQNRHAFCKKPGGLQTERKMPQQRGHSRSYNVLCVPLPMGCPRSVPLRSSIPCTRQAIAGRRTEHGVIQAGPSKKEKMERCIKVKIPTRREKNG